MIYATLIAAVILIAAIYTLILSRRAPDSVIDWWNSLISTFASVLLGVIVGIWLFGYGEFKTDEKEKDSYRSVLRSELSDTYRILSSGERMTITIGKNVYPVLITYVQPIAIEDAARSALFDEIVTENLLHLARKMRMLNVKTQFMLARISSGRPPNEDRFEENMKNAIRNIDETRESVISAIELLLKQLRIELSDSVPKDR